MYHCKLLVERKCAGGLVPWQSQSPFKISSTNSLGGGCSSLRLRPSM
ncbi:uncharacterized protein METZ01_LOCUS466618, partial [marine metagenome]